MDIQTIRSFLHAHDPSTVFPVLKWLSMCYGVGGAEIVDTPNEHTLHYFESSLTPDIREKALDTAMRAIREVGERPPIIQEWQYSTGAYIPDRYAPCYVASAQTVHIHLVGEATGTESVRLFRQRQADLPSVDGETRALFVGGTVVEDIAVPLTRWSAERLRRDFMNCVLAEVERRVMDRATALGKHDAARWSLWNRATWKQGKDARRRLWDRVTSLGDALEQTCAELNETIDLGARGFAERHAERVAVELHSYLTAQSARADFDAWVKFEYARTVVGFLIGPPRR
jgi:hypothetical protein